MFFNHHLSKISFYDILNKGMTSKNLYVVSASKYIQNIDGDSMSIVATAQAALHEKGYK